MQDRMLLAQAPAENQPESQIPATDQPGIPSTSQEQPQDQSSVETEPETVEEIVTDLSSGLEGAYDLVLRNGQRILDQFFSMDGLLQIVVVAITGVLMLLAARTARAVLGRLQESLQDSRVFRPGTFVVIDRLLSPIIWVALLWVGSAILRQNGLPNDMIRIVASLLNAWIVIRLFSTFVKDPLWSKLFAVVAWTIAALNILRLLNPVIAGLDSIAISVGDSRFSAYLALKGLLIFAVLLWGASLLTRFVQARVGKSASLTPSVQALIAQTVRIGLLFLVVMMTMNAIGVDLTALTVFSGAVGVGIGFGLQAIFSNFVAGIIMLIDKSIKVGDFVELESSLTGEVREINIRSTRVTTNDNVDILVPNSEFINNRVINWTLHENFKRTRIPFGVAYGTDKELVRKAALEAAEAVPHMLTGRGSKPPEVWLVNFGESSLDFELVVWIKPDSVKRPAKVNADYNWAIETALAKYGIEIPFPQRDLHFRSGELPIKLTEEIKKTPSKA